MDHPFDFVADCFAKKTDEAVESMTFRRFFAFSQKKSQLYLSIPMSMGSDEIRLILSCENDGVSLELP